MMMVILFSLAMFCCGDEVADDQLQMAGKRGAKKGGGRGKKRGGGGKSERAEKWQANSQLLLHYKNAHGHAAVPLAHVTEDGAKLGRWLKAVQKAWASGKLAQEKQDFLKGLGVSPGGGGGAGEGSDGAGSGKGDSNGALGVQKLHSRKALIASMMKALAEYKEANGNVDVPWDFETKDSLKLGMFLKGVLGKAASDKLPMPLRESLRGHFNSLGINFESYLKDAAKERSRKVEETRLQRIRKIKKRKEGSDRKI